MQSMTLVILSTLALVSVGDTDGVVIGAMDGLESLLIVGEGIAVLDPSTILNTRPIIPVGVSAPVTTYNSPSASSPMDLTNPE